jgi:hypothetical protein
MPLILSGNVATATAATTYEVANSCRFNDGDSAYLTRDLGTSTAGSGTKFTFSAWVKRGALGSDQYLFSSTISNHQVDLCFKDDDTLRYRLVYNNTVYGLLRTNAKFRDVSAWYHIVVNMDTTQSTAADRTSMYVNGTKVTSFSTSDRPNQNSTFTVNNNTVNNQDFSFGRNEDGPGDYFDGYMAEVVWIDGTTYAASNFGEFNSDSPRIWQPKDFKDDVTFGTHGVYLDFEDSGDLDDDESGNGNDFTATNLAATDQMTDTCTNNFAVMNSLAIHPSSTFTFSEANLQFATSSSTRGYWISTIAVSKGKWYFEYKCTNNQSRTCVGIAAAPAASNNDPESGDHDNVTAYLTINGKISYNSNAGTDNYYNQATGSDDTIIGCALDLTSSTNSIAFSINGAWVTGSGTTSTDFANVLLQDDFTNVSSTTNGQYFIIAGDDGGDQDIGGQINFGNPPFSISSGNADGNGYGNFEYAVPANYYSLCTKNLAEYG